MNVTNIQIRFNPEEIDLTLDGCAFCVIPLTVRATVGKEFSINAIDLVINSKGGMYLDDDYEVLSGLDFLAKVPNDFILDTMRKEYAKDLKLRVLMAQSAEELADQVYNSDEITH